MIRVIIIFFVAPILIFIIIVLCGFIEGWLKNDASSRGDLHVSPAADSNYREADSPDKSLCYCGSVCNHYKQRDNYD